MDKRLEIANALDMCISVTGTTHKEGARLIRDLVYRVDDLERKVARYDNRIAWYKARVRKLKSKVK